MGDEDSLTPFEAVPEPVVLVGLVDGEPVVRNVNAAFEECFGYSLDELRGESIHDYLVPDEGDRASAREFDEVAANGEHVRCEVVRETADGQREFLVRTSAFEERGTVKSLGIYVDVTERNRERRRFETLIQHTSDVVTILETDGTIRYESPSVEDVLGYDQEALVGENAFEYVHPEDREAVVDEFSRALSDPDSTPAIEYRFRTADGSWCTLESIGSNYVDNHSIQGYVVTSRDVTERKRRERELRRKNDRLDEFAGIISHDLRNPLNVAQGRLQLVAEECDSEHTEAVADALDRIETLVDDTLTLAREGRTIEAPVPIQLDDVAREAWRSVSTPNSELVVADDVETARGDADRVRELLENVFRNAVEHGSTSLGSRTRQDAVEHGATSNRPTADDAVEHGSGGGERPTDLSTSSESPGEGSAHADTDGTASGVTVRVGRCGDGFFVADDGVGIPDDDRDAVFESGYTTTDDGTGLGLVIVEQIADAHGWDVAVRESESGGARFEFSGVEFV